MNVECRVPRASLFKKCVGKARESEREREREGKGERAQAAGDLREHWQERISSLYIAFLFFKSEARVSAVFVMGDRNNIYSEASDSSDSDGNIDEDDGYYSDSDQGVQEDYPGREADERNVKREELRNVLKSMTLAQLRKLITTGIDGTPLHKALGLRGPASVLPCIKGTIPVGEADITDDYEEKKQQQTGSAAASSSSRARPAQRHVEERPKPGGKKKKRDKKRPREESSKVEVSRHRTVVHVPAPKVRDPRFDALSGEVSEHKFRESYAFLDDYRANEIAELKSKMQKIRSKARKKGKRISETRAEELRELQVSLTKLQQDQSTSRRERKFAAARSKVIGEERKKVAAGVKRPYYLKRREIKKVELTARYDELKSSGKLDKFMVKRRKKNAQKDRRMIPGDSRRR